MRNSVFLIGYSTKKVNDFVKILKNHSITLLADVRTIPKSRFNPDFQKERLEKILKENGIDYIHFKELGGLRKPKKESVNTGWRNDSFRGFADYMQTKEFKGALNKLVKLSRGERIVLMCAEGNPFKCHRSLVGDALIAEGLDVFNITGANSSSRHELTSFAKIKGGKVFYP